MASYTKTLETRLVRTRHKVCVTDGVSTAAAIIGAIRNVPPDAVLEASCESDDGGGSELTFVVEVAVGASEPTTPPRP